MLYYILTAILVIALIVTLIKKRFREKNDIIWCQELVNADLNRELTELKSKLPERCPDCGLYKSKIKPHTCPEKPTSPFSGLSIEEQLKRAEVGWTVTLRDGEVCRITNYEPGNKFPVGAEGWGFYMDGKNIGEEEVFRSHDIIAVHPPEGYHE